MRSHLARSWAHHRWLTTSIGVTALVVCVVVGLFAVIDGPTSGIGESRPLATDEGLRTLALRAPAGEAAYWLGPRFAGASPSNVPGGWVDGRASITYRYYDSSTSVMKVDLVMYTLARGTSPPYPEARVLTASDHQRIAFLIRRPRSPSRQFLSALQSALRPIPRNPHA
jgi:hypothetical protein